MALEKAVDPIVEKTSAELLREARMPVPDSRKIIDAVCQVCGISHEELFSPSRNRNLAHARLIAMHIMTRYLKAPQNTHQNIAKRLGGRDASTISTGIARAKELIKEDKAFRERIKLSSWRFRKWPPSQAVKGTP